MKDKACHTQSFWDLYKAINLKTRRNFPCSWCEQPLKIKWKKQAKTPAAKLYSGLLWMSPAIILIAMVATGMMNYLHAIILIILFHFTAMYFIINSGRLIVKNIKTKKVSTKKTTKKKAVKKKK